MSRLTSVLTGVIVLTLAVFGALADRALVDQARAAEEEALATADERARLAALAVHAALADVEQAVLADAPSAEVTVARLADRSRKSAPHGSSVPYLERSPAELVALLSSDELTTSGLPAAVVAAVALGVEEKKSQVAERLLSGLLPVRPEELPYLARALGVEGDHRVASLQNRARRAPGAESLPFAPRFRRELTERATVEGWARGDQECRGYEIPADVLLSRAGVADRALLSGDPSPETGDEETGRRVVPVPEVEGLALDIALELPGRLRILTLRIVLWVAVAASLLGLAAVVRAQRREARALSRERAFLGSVTHELRTPLAAIRLFGETLAEGRGDPKDYGALVAQESERLEALVERVLATTRIDEAPSFSRVNPGELVRSAVALVTGRAAQRDITLECHASAGEGASNEAMWDGEAVRRALLNLLDNAIKFGKQGGRIDVRAVVENERAELSVTDDGPGIGPQDRRRVFARFERGGTPSAGTGLGLYVVERIAQAHGGRVDLVTGEDRGCSFTLVLPLVPPGARTVSKMEPS